MGGFLACDEITRVNMFVEFVKEFLVPGGTWFLLVAASLAAALALAPRTARLGFRLLTAVVVLYWAMSTPLVAYGLQMAQSVRQHHAPTEAAVTQVALPIVVLGNGAVGFTAFGASFDVPIERTVMNTLFAVDQYRRHPETWVIASGGRASGREDSVPEAELIRDVMVRNGVPADRIVVENRSSNTHEQVVEVAKVLASRHARRCVVVTSPQQMPRAIDLFRREQIDVVPLVVGSLEWSPARTDRWWYWLAPSSAARAVSRDVFYELMAWPYYRLRGWLA